MRPLLPRGALFVLLALAACRSRPPPPAPPPDAAPLTEVDPADTVALWGRPRDALASDPPETVLLDAHGGVVRREPGVVVLTPAGPARLAVDSLSAPGNPCPQGHLPFPTRTLQRATLALPTTTPPVELLARASTDATAADELHAPLAGLGSLLLLRTDRVARPCDDPPAYSASLSAFAVSVRGVEKISTDELTRGADAGRAAASELLRRALPGAPPTPEVTAGLPALSAEGLRWSAQYTAAAGWAGADGQWGSETRSVRVAVSFPPRARPEARMPTVAARYLREHPEFTASGLSVGRLP